MASTRRGAAVTPSTWPSESLRVSSFDGVRSTQVYDDVETEVDEVFYVDLISLECTTNDEIEETQLIDLKSEDNRTAEVTIIDDDEPGVIAFQAPKEGSPAKALPPVTASEKSGHAKIRVGRFNGANGEVHVDCKLSLIHI